MFIPTPEDMRFFDADYLKYTCLLAQCILSMSGLEIMFSRHCTMSEITYTALKAIIETQMRAIVQHVPNEYLEHVLKDAGYLLDLFQAAQYDIGAQIDVLDLVAKYKAIKNIH